MPRQSLDDDLWNFRHWGKRGREMAPPTLSLLIQRAREGEPITYGELADQLERRYGFAQPYRKTFYGSPVGLVGFVLEELGHEMRTVLPPLNVIVINKSNRQPGSGADPLLRNYFRTVGQDFTPKLRRTLVNEAQEAVFDYGHRWKDVGARLGVKIWTPAAGRKKGTRALKLPKPVRGGGGESDQHHRLKLWACNHPEFFKHLGVYKQGVPEQRLASGDSIDAYFANDRQRLAVEVKPSDASLDERKRGVFQVVKYRAVMRAEQRTLGHLPNAQAILLTTQRPCIELRELMRRLEVEHILAPEHAED
ncbi:hypothetical protein BJI69_18050 [Luteibacter rhizovicinus DSM 16549]|uniref:Uncharacterized protein n=1 Tax=Luteibacter rhizovicinus DSM 16549 TaxID=1440763 RepID=A0A1L3EX34_9GAMM|nr:hypothetical protein [Luteibacter rhizovicinus]APG05619.1 hypothetical protein BJI69_18050 [Luteibacter rhizovicinus DSM 16549]